MRRGACFRRINQLYSCHFSFLKKITRMIMKRSLTSLCSPSLRAYRFILYPTRPFVNQSLRVLAPCKQFSKIGGDACSVLSNSHRNFFGTPHLATPHGEEDEQRPFVEEDEEEFREWVENRGWAFEYPWEKDAREQERQERQERLKQSKKRDRRAETFARKKKTEQNNRIVSLGKKGEWKKILELFHADKNKYDNVNWATAFSQLGGIDSFNRHDPLFESFVNEYSKLLREKGLDWSGVREVSNVIYTMGKMKLKKQCILDFASKEDNANRIVIWGMNQEVSNVAWAFAKLGVPAPVLFYEIDDDADRLVRMGSTQEVANLAWAYGKLGVKGRTLTTAIERHANWMVTEGNPQEVATVAWAFAVLGIRGVKSKGLFREIEARAEWLVQNGSTRDIATLAWAYAKLGIKEHSEIFAEIEKRVEWLVQSGNTQDVGNTAWAFAKLDVKLTKLFAEIEKRADWLVLEGKPTAVANTAWAFATLGVRSRKLFSEIDKRASWLVEKGRPQDAAAIAWAFSKLGMRSTNRFASGNSLVK